MAHAAHTQQSTPQQHMEQTPRGRTAREAGVPGTVRTGAGRAGAGRKAGTCTRRVKVQYAVSLRGHRKVGVRTSGGGRKRQGISMSTKAHGVHAIWLHAITLPSATCFFAIAAQVTGAGAAAGT